MAKFLPTLGGGWVNVDHIVSVKKRSATAVSCIISTADGGEFRMALKVWLEYVGEAQR